MVMNTCTLHFVLHCCNKYKLIFFVLNKVQDMLVGAAFLQKKKKNFFYHPIIRLSGL